VRQDGQRIGAPLVLIHALAGSLEQWDFVVAHMPSSQWIVRLDIVGHGGSDKPESGYSMPEQAVRVADIMRQLGVNHFSIAAHSGGGNIVVAMLENEAIAPRISHAVLIATPPNIRYVKLPLLAQIYGVPLLGRLMWHVTTVNMIKDTMKQLFAPNFGAVPDIFATDFQRMTRNSYVKCKAAVEGYIREQDFTRRVAKSSARLKIIFGAADQWVDPAATVQWQAESRAEIELLPGIGHTPVAECPELLASRIYAFIKT
jgi:pimeloyl-ACP methyl ester carboxylesterase